PSRARPPCRGAPRSSSSAPPRCGPCAAGTSRRRVPPGPACCRRASRPP
ncbi:MAG: hypothetical protein AVDCRST_MAG11-585, partial [uncultured Gemmatimonadaceae bacterium]